MSFWRRFRVFEDRYKFRTNPAIFEFSPRFACTGNSHFADDLVLRNGLWGCVCFSKTLKYDYSFTSFGDRATYFAFTVVSDAETLK